MFGPLELIPVEQFRRQLEVNVTGQLAVTQAALPLLRKARGRIVMIGSIGARFTPPFVGPLATSKSALATLSDALRAARPRSRYLSEGTRGRWPRPPLGCCLFRPRTHCGAGSPASPPPDRLPFRLFLSIYCTKASDQSRVHWWVTGS